MRFLADENVDREIVVELRSRGHEVAYVAEMEPGISDDELLSLANGKKAILITADKDFGEIVFRQRRATAGAVLIRLSGLPQEAKAKLVALAIEKHRTELVGAFTVVTRNHIRIRKVAPKE
jgi:predicted nuclease of predicted toxin-antitoxin system